MKKEINLQETGKIPVKKKTLQKTKLIILLFFIATCNLFANDLFQKKITLHLSNVALKEILSQIEEQSGYSFMYSKNIIDVDKKISINANDKELNETLRILFTETDINYTLKDRIIILSKLEKKLSDPVLNVPSKTITGKVTDSEDSPLIGVHIALEGTAIGTVTDANGNYSIFNVPNNATLTFSYIGMLTQRIKIREETVVNVMMQEDAIKIDEIVVVGYGTQKKATLTGSVVALQNEKIVTTKNENVANMLTGKMPGLRVSQLSSEPGTFNTVMDVRGMGSPLIIIDGIPRDNLMKLDAYDIESISVLKDASAAIYGVKAANGVILVTTRKSGESSAKVTYNGSMTWQMPSGLPETVDAVEYMTLANEHDMNVPNGGTWRYSQEMIDDFISGKRKNTNWYDAAIRNYAPQTQHHVNIAGKSDKTHYYTGMGYQKQESFFRTSDAFTYDKYNLRANLSTEFKKNFLFDLNLNGIMDLRKTTQSTSQNIVRQLWRQSPADPIYANDTAPYFYQTSLSENRNPVALINPDYIGYIHYQTKIFQSSASLTYQVPFIKGMSLKGLYSYDYNMRNDKNYRKGYYQYRYDEPSQKYIAYPRDFPSQIRKDISENVSTIYQLSLSYTGTFNKAHEINALFLTEGKRSRGDGFYARRDLSIELDELFAGNADNQIGAMNPSNRYEYANESFIGRVNYNFLKKYLIEAAFRADGSSRFPSNSRWGFFPSASAGYVISEESFWKHSALHFISNLKIRGSYGLLGDDSDINYQFISGYTYPDKVSIFGDNVINGAVTTGIPNRNITWYQSETMNIGFDMTLWNGLLGAAFDVFQRYRTGLLTTRLKTLPGTMGATFPKENLNSDKNFGYEIELSHRYKWGDWRWNFKGHLTLTRLKNIYVETAEYRSHYHNWRSNSNDRYKDIWWGQEAGGQYNSFIDIAENPIYTDRTKLPGDYYHKDWNGDGIVDTYDLHPLGYGIVDASSENFTKYSNKPLLNFGFTLDLTYKNFDCSMLWQGSALSNVFYNEILMRPLQAGVDNTLERFLDRWRPVDPHANPYDQGTEFIQGKYPMPGGSSYPGNSSEYSVYRNRYVRLKNIEIGYNLPDKLLKYMNMDNLRISIGGYNLLTFSPVDFVDPEHPMDNNGYMYPLNKTLTVGLSCKF